jgi:hypothetical protein
MLLEQVGSDMDIGYERNISYNGKLDSENNRFWTDDEGLYHREDGPAFMFNNGDVNNWVIHGLHHRIDGPAIEYNMGDNYDEFFIHGEQITFEEWKEYLINKSGLPTNEVTRLILKYS